MPAIRPATVLIVDDEPALRALVRAVLQDAGYRVLEAADGVQGLDLAARERPDLVLLDVALPRLSGLEVCRLLRERPATASTPVLLLTGLPAPDHGAVPLSAGATGSITKPFHPQGLLQYVRRALGEPANALP